MNALIILNGKKLPDKVLKSAEKDKDIIICADGGAVWAYKAKIHVDVLIGDFDSIGDDVLQKYIQNDVKIVTLPKRKDETDGLLAVDYAMEYGCDNIEIIGATGGRLDHQMGNVMLLKRMLDKNCKGRLLFENGWGMMSCEPIDIKCRKGDTISVLPYCGNVAINSSTGLYYPINSDTEFTYSYPIGISNEVVEDTVHLDITSGYVLVFVYDI